MTAEDGTERYDRNPLLAIIESYALDVIGELSPEEVEEAACAVEQLLGEADDWRGALRRELRWNALVDATIADRWHRFRAARRGDDEPDAAEFARAFADDVTRLARS
jgi:hypothetical protein